MYVRTLFYFMMRKPACTSQRMYEYERKKNERVRCDYILTIINSETWGDLLMSGYALRQKGGYSNSSSAVRMSDSVLKSGSTLCISGRFRTCGCANGEPMCVCAWRSLSLLVITLINIPVLCARMRSRTAATRFWIIWIQIIDLFHHCSSEHCRHTGGMVQTARGARCSFVLYFKLYNLRLHFQFLCSRRYLLCPSLVFTVVNAFRLEDTD